MNRNFTNVIRVLMDEGLPAFIRDNKYFMYPFFLYAYRGQNIKTAMHFKKLVYSFSNEEYINYYNNLNTISRNRLTDLSGNNIHYILSKLDKTGSKLIDIGCGNGYLLEQIKKVNVNIDLHGVDIFESKEIKNFTYHKAQIENLPFENKSFDIVTCCHTIEHIINPEKAINELIRITKKQLIIVVPCQRFFYYTLDEHVNFFQFKEQLTHLIKLKDFTCEKKWGDWVYIANLTN